MPAHGKPDSEMTLGLYDPERRYRKRVWGNIVRFGFYVTTIAVASLFTYQIGSEQAKDRVTELETQLAQVNTLRVQLEQTAVQLQAAAQTAQIEYRNLLQRFNREVPTGVNRDLADRVARRLGEGVPADRIAFYIDQASVARDCSEPESKRFILPTEVYSGPNTSVAFAQNRIIVSGRGESARDQDGNKAAWFDPTKTVSISFKTIGDEQSAVTGTLPLVHSVVLGDEEFRFTVTEGDERSFVRVTSDRCVLPDAEAPVEPAATPQ